MKKTSIKTEVTDLLYASSINSLLVSCIIASLLIYLQFDASASLNIIIWAGLLGLAIAFKKILYFFIFVIKNPEKKKIFGLTYLD